MTFPETFRTAINHHQNGRLDSAIPLYQSLLEQQPNHPDVLHLLGLALHQSGKDDQAIPLFERAIALKPTADYYANFAELWRRQEKYDKAIDCYRHVLEQLPSDVEIRYLLAEALVKSEKYEEAVAELQICLTDGKADSNTWAVMCEALRRMERLDEAIEAAKKAVALGPNSAPAWHSLGWTLMRQGKIREGLPYIDQAIRLKPDWALVIWRRAFANLTLGNFVDGWRDYESRWLDSELQLKTARNLPGQIWRGQDITGKRVFVHMEQGVGDLIQTIRYIPMIFARGAEAVVLEAPMEIYPLARRSFPRLELLTEDQQKIRYNFFLPIMSLPLAFGTKLETIPAETPYLRADEEAIGRWKARLAETGGLKVGLVWAGSPTHANDKNRSMLLKQFLPLASVPGVQFVSLQKGERAKQVAEVPELNLIDWTEELRNYDDTAALVSALDLVIAVDTSVAHLAGALGKPVWVMIAYAPDFRWMLEREDSPWYPTMRLFRQPSIGDWESVVRRVGEELRVLASAQSDAPVTSPQPSSEQSVEQ